MEEYVREILIFGHYKSIFNILSHNKFFFV